MALTDRTLFLLLSPNSTTIPLLTRQWGLTYSFARNAETGVLSLVLRGNVKSVEMGRREVEGVADVGSLALDFALSPALNLTRANFQISAGGSHSPSPPACSRFDPPTRDLPIH